ncbi:MAG: hypothetical protein ACYDHD_05355 [Vulcanimicrobiaceae bacterium]
MKHCALRHVCPSINRALLALAVVFVVGALLYGIGLALSRVPGPPPSVGWTSLITGDDRQYDRAARLEMLDRLLLIGAPWCVPIARSALTEERDEALRSLALRICESAQEITVSSGSSE